MVWGLVPGTGELISHRFRFQSLCLNWFFSDTFASDWCLIDIKGICFLGCYDVVWAKKDSYSLSLFICCSYIRRVFYKQAWWRPVTICYGFIYILKVRSALDVTYILVHVHKLLGGDHQVQPLQCIAVWRLCTRRKSLGVRVPWFPEVC